MGGAQSLSRAGFDPWIVALLARHSGRAVLGYIREAPLTNSEAFARRAIAGLSGVAGRVLTETEAVDATIAVAGLPPARDHAAQVPPGASASSGLNESADSGLRQLVREEVAKALEECRRDEAETTGLPLQALEDRIATIEALRWTGSKEKARAAIAWRSQVEVATQTSQDPGGPGTPFVANARTQVVHLDVPRALLPGEGQPKTFCGWEYTAPPKMGTACSRLPRDPQLICERCLPGLRSKYKKKFKDMAARVAAQVGPEAEELASCAAGDGGELASPADPG